MCFTRAPQNIVPLFQSQCYHPWQLRRHLRGSSVGMFFSRPEPLTIFLCVVIASISNLTFSNAYTLNIQWIHTGSCKNVCPSRNVNVLMNKFARLSVIFVNTHKKAVNFEIKLAQISNFKVSLIFESNLV